jgi:hypothetical protein
MMGFQDWIGGGELVEAKMYQTMGLLRRDHLTILNKVSISVII